MATTNDSLDLLDEMFEKRRKTEDSSQEFFPHAQPSPGAASQEAFGSAYQPDSFSPRKKGEPVGFATSTPNQPPPKKTTNAPKPARHIPARNSTTPVTSYVKNGKDGISKPKKHSAFRIWRLFKMQYIVTFRFCLTCRKKLYNNMEKARYNGQKTSINFELCEKCTSGNLEMADCYDKFFA